MKHFEQDEDTTYNEIRGITDTEKSDIILCCDCWNKCVKELHIQANRVRVVYRSQFFIYALKRYRWHEKDALATIEGTGAAFWLCVSQSQVAADCMFGSTQRVPLDEKALWDTSFIETNADAHLFCTARGSQTIFEFELSALDELHMLRRLELKDGLCGIAIGILQGRECMLVTFKSRAIGQYALCLSGLEELSRLPFNGHPELILYDHNKEIIIVEDKSGVLYTFYLDF